MQTRAKVRPHLSDKETSIQKYPETLEGSAETIEKKATVFMWGWGINHCKKTNQIY